MRASVLAGILGFLMAGSAQAQVKIGIVGAITVPNATSTGSQLNSSSLLDSLRANACTFASTCASVHPSSSHIVTCATNAF